MLSYEKRLTSLFTYFPKKSVFLFLLFSLLGLGSFFFLDREIAVYIYPLRSRYAHLFTFCSHLIFPPFYLFSSALLLFITRFFSRKEESFLLFEITLVQFLSAGIVRILKVLISRGRPEVFLSSTIEISKDPFSHHYHSFPSGHSMAVFSLAASFTFFYPRFSSLFFSGAFLLSTSRVWLLDHYLSDLFGTAAIAIAIAHFVHIYLKRLSSSLH